MYKSTYYLSDDDEFSDQEMEGIDHAAVARQAPMCLKMRMKEERQSSQLEERQSSQLEEGGWRSASGGSSSSSDAAPKRSFSNRGEEEISHDSLGQSKSSNGENPNQEGKSGQPYKSESHLYSDRLNEFGVLNSKGIAASS